MFLDEGERVTASKEQVGSRFYISPECEDGRQELVGVESDVYSTGKLLYYLASGGKIFAREQHRSPEYNLAHITSDPFLEHVSMVLDQAVVEYDNAI